MKENKEKKRNEKESKNLFLAAKRNTKVNL